MISGTLLLKVLFSSFPFMGKTLSKTDLRRACVSGSPGDSVLVLIRRLGGRFIEPTLRVSAEVCDPNKEEVDDFSECGADRRGELSEE